MISPESQTQDNPEERLYIVSSLAHNRRIVNHCRNFAAIVAGLLAGFLGFTGIRGILVYLAVTFLSSVAMLGVVKFDAKPYFPSCKEVLYGQLLGGILSFILIWTLAYDMAYIF
eukprot:GHVR01039733.1.p1 GENE.GHVR01039733.1~~GHVR01039733.1.p1  ORF type:complete len:124 (-),score=7.04 GHVR01039733.1:213-554(-)